MTFTRLPTSCHLLQLPSGPLHHLQLIYFVDNELNIVEKGCQKVEKVSEWW